MARDACENMVADTATIFEALKVIDSQGVAIALVQKDGVLLGTVTDGDIRRGMLAGISVNDSVTQVMNAKPITAHEGIGDAEALRVMRAASILQLPLIGANGRITGLRVLKDLQPGETTQPNPVVIMAGGLGSRLQGLTADRPKPMVEVGGRPILESIIERFVAQGFTDITLSVNYKKEVIADHFGDGGKWGAHISYLHEPEPLGTAGALSLLPKRPTRPLIVMNSDILSKVNFQSLAKFHDDQGAPATMCVHEYKFVVPYGVVTTDGPHLTEIEEKPSKTFIVNAGIYVVDPTALDFIPTGRRFDMPELFGALMNNAKDGKGKRPAAFLLWEYLADINRIPQLIQAEREFRGLFEAD
jgi:choline kinase